jgi:hypothetical protein
MPLDRSFDYSWKAHCVGWQLKFCLLPKRCAISNKLLWFTFAYRGVAMWTGPGSPVFDPRWVDKKEYIFAKIKGVI